MHGARVNANLQWISTVQAILTGLTTAGVLTIVWIGWLRTRRIGYLVLAAWSLTVLLGVVMQSLYFPIVQTFLGNNVRNQMRYEFFMWAQLIRSLVSGALLIAGLALLVFGGSLSRNPDAR
jgi:hypothetical protein